MEKAKGGGNGSNQFKATNATREAVAQKGTLKDLGISPKQSSNWQRLAGQLLAEMEKAKGTAGMGRPSKDLGPAMREAPKSTATLKDLGISPKQSSNWQRLAKVPDEQFERAIDRATRPQSGQRTPQTRDTSPAAITKPETPQDRPGPA